MHRERVSKSIARSALIGLSFCFIIFIILIPLFEIFREAFAKGFQVYFAALTDEDALSALKLTIITAFFSVLFNLVFGVSAAWLISNYNFRFKSLLITIIDLPLAISPVIVGMLFVLLFGIRGFFGNFLQANNFEVIFAVPGIILVTTFICCPILVRELLPVMEQKGSAQEEAALTMGASGFQIFTRVTLPAIKWGLLYGIILTNARAMGEFGAVSVVSGHIRGETNTLPLQIEILYNEYKFNAAFAVSTLLAGLAILTLIVKKAVEHKFTKRT